MFPVVFRKCASNYLGPRPHSPAGDNVEVDESLFQDLDDLALEDDENADLDPADLDDYD